MIPDRRSWIIPFVLLAMLLVPVSIIQARADVQRINARVEVQEAIFCAPEEIDFGTRWPNEVLERTIECENVSPNSQVVEVGLEFEDDDVDWGIDPSGSLTYGPGDTRLYHLRLEIPGDVEAPSSHEVVVEVDRLEE